jgi:hypothetical protein
MASNVQQLIDTDPDPAGSTFCFTAGHWRLPTPWLPRAGQEFVGALGPGGERLTILSGSKVLEDWTSDGAGRWYVDGQTQQAPASRGECATTHPQCLPSNELFRNGQRVKAGASLLQVGPGTWWFDYANDRVWVGDDPAGQLLEISIAQQAFSSTAAASNVVFRNFVVEQFANDSGGAIRANAGAGSVIEYVEARDNHSTGLSVGVDGVLRKNWAHHNGKMGLSGGGSPNSTAPTNVRVEGNEVSYNNEAGFRWQWEGGGSKFTYNNGLWIVNNFYHHNFGPGIWTDINNIDVHINGNRSSDNGAFGISHEIGYRAEILDNILERNGTSEPAGRGGGAGIYIYNARDTTIRSNVMLDNKDGVVARQDRRGSGPFGTYEVANLLVENNRTRYADTGGRSGLLTSDPVYFTGKNNRWVANTYEVPVSPGLAGTWFFWQRASRWFPWQQASRTWVQWQGYGHDLTDTMTTY